MSFKEVIDLSLFIMSSEIPEGYPEILTVINGDNITFFAKCIQWKFIGIQQECPLCNSMMKFILAVIINRSDKKIKG